VDDFEEELACPRVEDEDGTVDGFGRQVAFKCLQHILTKYTTYDIVILLQRCSLSSCPIGKIST